MFLEDQEGNLIGEVVERHEAYLHVPWKLIDV